MIISQSSLYYNTTNVPKSEQPSYTHRRKFNNSTVREILCDSLDNSCWESVLKCEDVDTTYDIFIQSVTDKLKQVCRISKLKTKHKTNEKSRISGL